MESELFGHVKGAFTGAEYNRIGRFEAATGGSIFLDEIGDLPMATQTKLLRVLQEKEIERVGDHRPFKVDVRIITATNKDLVKQIADGLFREDLYYRINVIPLTMPPLRDRASDIPLLVENFINKIQQRTNTKSIKGISVEAMETLVAYQWPGNVRELMNAIEYAFVLCPGGIITPRHLPAHFRDRSTDIPAASTPTQQSKGANQKQQLLEALQRSRGNRSQAATILGVSRVTVWQRMKKYEIIDW